MHLVRDSSGALIAEHRYRSLLAVAAILALLGLYMGLAGLRWIPASEKARPMDLLIGSAAMLLGAGSFASYRQGFRIDPVREEAVRQVRALGISWTKRLALTEVQAVTLTRRTVRARQTSAQAWVLECVRASGEPFELTRFVDRAEAERVLPLVREAVGRGEEFDSVPGTK